MLAALILVSEFAFWVFIALGLTARYLLRRPRLGAALLILAPFVDLVLLVASVLDLRGGGDASIVHALAAIYIGVSVGFGHSMIRWADARFAYRFAGGPRPVKPSKYGPAAARREVGNWLRHLLAYAVGSGLMLGGVLLVGDPDRTRVLLYYPGAWGIVLVIDAIITGFDVATALSGRDADESRTADGESGREDAERTGPLATLRTR
jgi:hypothetical protein